MPSIPPGNLVRGGRKISPPGAFLAALAYLVAAAVFGNLAALVTAATMVMLGQAFLVRRLEPAIFLLKVTLPLALPLLVVHGVLNPQFQASTYLIGMIPLRPAGLAFASVISFRLLVIAASMSIWRYTVGVEVMEFFNRIHFPPALITGLAVAVASIELVQRKARAVYLAQQARGYDFRANWWTRIVGLPKLIIPVVTVTLVEGSERGVTMENRGLDLGRWRVPDWYTAPTAGRLFAELVPVVLVFGAYWVR